MSGLVSSAQRREVGSTARLAAELDAALALVFAGRQPPPLHWDRLDVDGIRRDLAATGYAVAKNLLPLDTSLALRSHWLQTFNAHARTMDAVPRTPLLGQDSRLGRVNDTSRRQHQAHDFLWNAPLHPQSRDVGLLLDLLRNAIEGTDLLSGVRMGADRTGLALTATYEAPQQGFRTDEAATLPRLQVVLPLTHRAVDYRRGGLAVRDRAGVRQDLDALLRPGDLLFFDGTLPTGVDPIVPFDDGPRPGRLTLSPVPTRFETVEENAGAVPSLSLRRVANTKVRGLIDNVRGRLGL